MPGFAPRSPRGSRWFPRSVRPLRQGQADSAGVIKSRQYKQRPRRGYPGGLHSRTLGDQLERRPEEVIRRAVRGMLPRNRLARKQLTKLKVYAGPDHPHAAQKPDPLEIET